MASKGEVRQRWRDAFKDERGPDDPYLQLILRELADWINRDGMIRVSTKVIGRRCRMHDSTVRERLVQLEGVWIEKYRQGRSNVYRPLFPSGKPILPTVSEVREKRRPRGGIEEEGKRRPRAPTPPPRRSNTAAPAALKTVKTIKDCSADAPASDPDGSPPRRDVDDNPICAFCGIQVIPAKGFCSSCDNQWLDVLPTPTPNGASRGGEPTGVAVDLSTYRKAIPQ